MYNNNIKPRSGIIKLHQKMKVFPIYNVIFRFKGGKVSYLFAKYNTSIFRFLSLTIILEQQPTRHHICLNKTSIGDTIRDHK